MRAYPKADKLLISVIILQVVLSITKAGLHVKTFLRKGVYETGERVSSKEMKTLNLQPHFSIC